MEETPGEGRHQMQHGAHGAGALAEQGDIVGVAAEGGNVVPDPGEGEQLVVEAEIARRLVRLQAEPAEDAQAVVHTHQYNLSR